MALNFPDNPSINDTYSDSTSGFTYRWNGTVWLSVTDRKIGNIKKIDDISAAFNGVETIFNLTSNGEVIAPLDTNKTIISLGGVLQNPGDDFSVFGSSITFSTPPTAGLSFFGQVLQTERPKGTIADGTVGPEDLSTGGFSWNSSGDFIVSGILTSGTSSVTINGSTNRINVGTGLTISSTGITAGIITANTFYGSGVNLTNAGFGTQSSANTSGIITARSFSGDGRGLTDVGGYLAGLIYSPGIGQTNVATSSGIAITFTKSIKAGIGTITLRTVSAAGTITESYDVTSSNRITISGASISISPTSALGAGTTYYVVIPQGTLKDTYGTGGNIGITSYYFETAPSIPVVGFYVWGGGGNGELGLNDTVARSSPTQVPGTQWSKVDGGNSDTLAIKTDGTLWGWGSSGVKIGLNDTVARSSPTQVPGTQWSKVRSGNYSTISIKTDGTLWMWGNNQSANLGQNDAVPYSSPRQIPGTQWNDISLYRLSPLAKKTDGTLWAWGSNSYGSLGLNDRVVRSSPTQIPGTQWSNVNSGSDLSTGIKTDGTLWSWGYNTVGALGFNDVVHRSSPTQIPGTQWNKSLGNWSNQMIATKTDGTLWVWGSQNGFGRLGLNDAVHRSSPTQIPGTQWFDIGTGYNFNFASKTDGTLWAWGSNYQGQLGLNDVVQRSSPTQIPGNNWTTLERGFRGMYVIRS